MQYPSDPSERESRDPRWVLELRIQVSEGGICLPAAEFWHLVLRAPCFNGGLPMALPGAPGIHGFSIDDWGPKTKVARESDRCKDLRPPGQPGHRSTW